MDKKVALIKLKKLEGQNFHDLAKEYQITVYKKQ